MQKQIGASAYRPSGPPAHVLSGSSKPALPIPQRPVSRWRVGLLWLASAVTLPALLFGLWVAPVMRFMDGIRNSTPKADWIVAIHGVSYQFLLIGLVALLGLAALHTLKGRRQAAHTLLVQGGGGLFAMSLGVLILVWV